MDFASILFRIHSSAKATVEKLPDRINYVLIINYV